MSVTITFNYLQNKENVVSALLSAFLEWPLSLMLLPTLRYHLRFKPLRSGKDAFDALDARSVFRSRAHIWIEMAMVLYIG